MGTLKEIQESFKSGKLTKPEYIDRMHEVHSTIFQYASFLQGTDIEKLEIAGLLDEMGVDIIEGGTVLDVGANIGYYTLSLCRQVKNVRVHAFEPIPKTFALLQEHVRINRATGATLHHFGLSDREEIKTFYYYPEGSGNASSANLSPSASVETMTCQVKRLDDFVQSNGLHVDFIKCDVEGAELFVFRGAMATLKRDRPAVFTEMLRKWAAKFSYHPNDIIVLMKDLGYRCFCEHLGFLRPFSTMNEETVETNFFFLHPEKHGTKIQELVRE